MFSIGSEKMMVASEDCLRMQKWMFLKPQFLYFRDFVKGRMLKQNLAESISRAGKWGRMAFQFYLISSDPVCFHICF